MDLEIKTADGFCDEVGPLFTLCAAKFELLFTVSERTDVLGREPFLRGKIGFSLRRACCPFSDFRDRPCEGCVLSRNCLYILLFSPIPNGPAPGTKQRPPLVRPFVISLRSDAGNEPLRPGETATAELTLFGPAIRDSAIFLDAAAASVGALGLRLKQIRRLSCGNGHEAPPLSDWIAQEENPPGPGQVALRFLTPTRFSTKKGRARDVVPFSLVVKSLVRRLRDLKRAYGPDEDMGKTGEHFFDTAARVNTEECRLSWANKHRFSQRQKKTVRLEGITGEIRYAEPSGLFLPLLLAGQFVHVGKGTSCGNGKMAVLKMRSDGVLA